MCNWVLIGISWFGVEGKVASNGMMWLKWRQCGRGAFEERLQAKSVVAYDNYSKKRWKVKHVESNELC